MREHQAAPTEGPPGPLPPARTIGLGGATGVGVGAIVGGGIFVLAGVAYLETGPGATLAFAINALLAYVAVFSFAELTTRFPENGGTYAFARKTLSVRAAFAVGWVLWFAHIVTGVLYALGFATFTVIGLAELTAQLGIEPPAWLAGRNLVLFLGAVATLGYGMLLTRRSGGGGQGANIGKVAVFAVIIVAGLVALARQPLSDTGEALTPFMPGGLGGLVAAMGFTFIALQGVGLIAAVGGEIRDPSRNVPRAMFISLTIAVALYVPLVFLVSTVGVAPGVSIQAMAARDTDAVFADGVRRFMGDIGYWLVVVAAILSTLSALHANLLAGSRVALSMGIDRTLPTVFAQRHASLGTPVVATYATSLGVVATLFMVSDLAAAGAAASLIFLVAYVLTHVIAYLARRREEVPPGAFRSPWFPLLPIVGAITSGGVALFQAFRTPTAGGIAVIWLGLGVLLYLALFRSGAETADETAEALDPALARLRGRNPLVLVPVANPEHARSRIELANAMAPSGFARVLLLTVVPPAKRAEADPLARLSDALQVVRTALETSYADGYEPVAMISAASPWEEIRRIAIEHACESLLVGMSPAFLGRASGRGELERLTNDVDCDVAVVSAPPGWELHRARRILVPVGYCSDDERGLRARMLGVLVRDGERTVIFAASCATDASDAEVERAKREATAQAANTPGAGVEVLRGDDPVQVFCEAAAEYDVVVLGLRTVGWQRRKVLGSVAHGVSQLRSCATILLSRRSGSLGRAMSRPLGAMARLTALGAESEPPPAPPERAER